MSENNSESHANTRLACCSLVLDALVACLSCLCSRAMDGGYYLMMPGQQPQPLPLQVPPPLNVPPLLQPDLLQLQLQLQPPQQQQQHQQEQQQSTLNVRRQR